MRRSFIMNLFISKFLINFLKLRIDTIKIMAAKIYNATVPAMKMI